FPNGWLVEACPVEIASMIINELSIADILLYAATSSANYKLMHEQICRQVVRSLRPFGVHINDFSEMLHTHRAVVLGSFVLYVFDRSGGWAP
ncbi:hypothetical protein OG21DRAFT_1399062, partial [Imleria badia]